MARIENLDEATARIESALYSAGRPLRIEDLIRASGTESRTKTLELLSTIMKKTKTAFKALEVTILPDGSYVMQLKPEYSSTVKRYASKPILPESIFALQKAAMEKKPMYQRTDVDIELIDIPYRHESTYPVSLDDLLGLLQNLIGTIANPQSRRNKQLEIEPIEAPDFNEFFISLESIIGKYEDLVMKKISLKGFGLLQEIISELDQIDSIRCFFAILFLARDQRVDLEQIEDDIKIIAIKEPPTN